MAEPYRVCNVCAKQKISSYMFGDLAVRASSPYDTSVNNAQLKTLDLSDELRCLTFPSLASPLVLAYACRAAYPASENTVWLI